MFRVLILVFASMVVVAEIIDRKQNYSDDEALRSRPSRSEQIAVDFRKTPWIQRDGFVHTTFKFPSDKGRYVRTRRLPVEQEGKKTEPPEIKVPFIFVLKSRLSAWASDRDE
ncbi:MAG: hypothetical protein ACE5H4_16410 [Candidatus Thorarchaeota archaeon]